MSVCEVKTFRWTCEHCRAQVVGVGTSEHASRPADWGYKTLYDCGMTGYTTVIDLCASCSPLPSAALAPVDAA